MKALVVAAAGLTLIAPGALWAAQKLGEVQAPRAPQTVYAQTCGYCHGRNVGPIILGRHLPAEYIRQMARSGRNGMPAFRPTEVTNAELDGLAQWISASAAPAKELGH
ncbi:cytochrome c [Novosphingobium sp.]|uniref:cytochrome c n=1 Tax=Novosphingobium sp. TaxID=1874826 RepID=UPI0033411F15